MISKIRFTCEAKLQINLNSKEKPLGNCERNEKEKQKKRKDMMEKKETKRDDYDNDQKEGIESQFE